MPIVPASRQEIYVEEVSYKSSISELTAQKQAASINWLLANAGTQLGDIVPSALTQAQFQSLRGNNWVQLAGQSIVGSDFALLTGITTLANMVNGDTLIKADSDASRLTRSTGSNQTHSHTQRISSTGGSMYDWERISSSSGTTYWGMGSALVRGDATFGKVTTATSGDTANNLASGVKVNYFIKINNNPT
jgi:hypothetical protein